ncbi:MAG: transcription antitermination factor NusB [Deltaproteobacteria bacterium]|nr:transcription antitermination factor NusB [Deltaproteobacteria bacterium]
MGIRRKARELALKALYENEFNAEALSKITDRIQIEQRPEPDVMQFLQQLLTTYEQNRDHVNRTIEQHSSHWKLGRMASVDRNILRLGVTEIMYIAEVPKNVTINECLEIAKKYGTEDSSSFVNGILDKITKTTT